MLWNVILAFFSSLRMVCSTCCLVRWSLAGWNVLLIPCSHSPQSSLVRWAITQYFSSPLPALSLMHQTFTTAQPDIPRNERCFSSRLRSVDWVNLYSCICFPSTFLQIILVKKEASGHFSGRSKVTRQRVFEPYLPFMFVSWNLSQSVFLFYFMGSLR